MIEGHYYGIEFWVLYLKVAGPIAYLLVGVWFGMKAAPHLDKYMALKEMKESLNRDDTAGYKNRRRIQYAALGAIVVFWPVFAAVVIPLSFKPVRDRIGP